LDIFLRDGKRAEEPGGISGGWMQRNFQSVKRKIKEHLKAAILWSVKCPVARTLRRQAVNLLPEEAQAGGTEYPLFR